MAQHLTTSLRLELEKTNGQFDRWINHAKDSLESNCANYGQMMEECNYTIKALEENDKMLENSRQTHENIKRQQKQEIEKSISQNEQLKRNKDLLEVQLKRCSEEEERERQRLEQARLEHEALRCKMEQSLNDLTYGVKKFLSLGLEFQKTETDCMKFSFTQVDERNPHQQFYFLMYVDENNMYQLVETNPKLDSSNCKKLLDYLNSTNNIGGFVFNMRKMFRSTVRR
jgi:hypothetical protein